jgi:hypothetical protein
MATVLSQEASMSSVVVKLSEDIFEGQWRPNCAICGESVKLEESKADERGQAIHEDCYVSKLGGKKIPQRRNYL